ncbi:MAG: hypothetical protein SOH81_09250, partial [Acetobacter sp.]
QRTKTNRAEYSTEAGLKVKDQSAAVSRGIDPHLNTVNSLSEKFSKKFLTTLRKRRETKAQRAFYITVSQPPPNAL